mmetsp:Transcript_68641/g.185450  ORF Transcript_68641/g.185450 Transcript_68641/m.185450 type:complete len:222 (+) Transcript_68641:540-1205(+)
MPGPLHADSQLRVLQLLELHRVVPPHGGLLSRRGWGPSRRCLREADGEHHRGVPDPSAAHSADPSSAHGADPSAAAHTADPVAAAHCPDPIDNDGRRAVRHDSGGRALRHGPGAAKRGRARRRGLARCGGVSVAALFFHIARLLRSTLLKAIPLVVLRPTAAPRCAGCPRAASGTAYRRRLQVLRCAPARAACAQEACWRAAHSRDRCLRAVCERARMSTL